MAEILHLITSSYMNRYYSDVYAAGFFRLACAMLPMICIGNLISCGDAASSCAALWYGITALVFALALVVRCLWLIWHDAEGSPKVAGIFRDILGFPYYILLCAAVFQAAGRDDVAIYGYVWAVIWIVGILLTSRRAGVRS